jgi:hypothetical protein
MVNFQILIYKHKEIVILARLSPLSLISCQELLETAKIRLAILVGRRKSALDDHYEDFAAVLRSWPTGPLAYDEKHTGQSRYYASIVHGANHAN